MARARGSVPDSPPPDPSPPQDPLVGPPQPLVPQDPEGPPQPPVLQDPEAPPQPLVPQDPVGPPQPPAPQDRPPVGPPQPLAPMPPLYLPKSVMRSSERDKDSALHTACLAGSYDQTLMLLLRGHNPCPLNVWLETPLHHCTSRGHLHIMMLLLDSSALVNATDHQGLTPLHQAIIHGNREACELLLCYGASIHGGEGVKEETFGVKGVNSTRSPLELASHVHVCHRTVENALGRVWTLQHSCRITIRRSLGASRRRRLKELPLPPHLLAFLSTLPVSCSDALHANWDRRRSSKSEAVRKRGEVKRRAGGGGRGRGGLHLLRQSPQQETSRAKDNHLSIV